MKQIYGIIRSDADPAFDKRVYGVREGGLTAVVDDAPKVDYRSLTQETLLQHITLHQKIVEGLLQAFPFLPFQFGSHLQDDAQVRYMLRHWQDRFLRLWAEFEGYIQIRVRILWDPQRVSREIAGELNVPAIQAEAAGRPFPEQEETRSEIRRMLQVKLAQRQADLEELVRAHLEPIAKRIARNPQMNDETAVDFSVLLLRAHAQKLKAISETLDTLTEGQYQIRCVGPLPPYSFAKVSVRAPKPHLIARARERLGLGETATPAEMKAAFHAHPDYIRPDRNSDLDSIIKMTELAQAYKLLKEFAASQPGEVCRLDAAAIAQTVIVTIQRPEKK